MTAATDSVQEIPVDTAIAGPRQMNIITRRGIAGAGIAVEDESIRWYFGGPLHNVFCLPTTRPSTGHSRINKLSSAAAYVRLPVARERSSVCCMALFRRTDGSRVAELRVT